MSKAIALLLLSALALAADVTGKWTARFDTQIGVQNYTYEFQAKGAALTGTASSESGKVQIADGKIDGDKISFVENLSYEGYSLRIVYEGVVAGDEIKFTRKVGDIATEQLTAKRAK